MNLTNLFEVPKKFEKELIQELKPKESLPMSKRLLLLQAEFGSLAKDAGCCNFLKDNVDCKDDIFEKYINCLQLILTIGREKNYSEVNIEAKFPELDLVQQFLNLFIDLNDYIVCSYEDHYITLLEDFLSLGLSLGFREDQIFMGCKSKYQH
ncbi:MAG TPA: dUTP diphosphatase [Clostridiaceae bacterium]